MTPCRCCRREHIASGSGDTTVRVWDKRSGECKVTFEGHTGRVYAFCEVDGGERIVSGGADKTVRLWNALSGECALTFEGHAGTVWSVCMADSGKRIVSGSARSCSRGIKPPSFRCCMSNGGQRIVSGNGDVHTVRLWCACQTLVWGTLSVSHLY